MPLIAEAALYLHMGSAPLAEYLVTRGAALDRDWGSHIGGSVRAALPSLVEDLADPHDPQVLLASLPIPACHRRPYQ